MQTNTIQSLVLILLLMNNPLTKADDKIDTSLKLARPPNRTQNNTAILNDFISRALIEPPSSRIYGVSFFYFVTLLSSFALQTLSRQTTLLFNLPLMAATSLNSKLLGIVFNVGILLANLNKPLLVFLALPMFASVALAIAAVLAGITLPIGKRRDLITKNAIRSKQRTDYSNNPDTFYHVVNSLNQNNFKLNVIADNADEYFKKTNNNRTNTKYLRAKPREGLKKIKFANIYPIHRMKKLVAILRLRIAYLTKTGG